MKKRSLAWALRLLFYVFLDAVTGAVIYGISIGEADLAPGQLAIRILTAMTLVSAIVGGPDFMLYWQESGRRIAAEQERDEERDARIAAEERLQAAMQERDARIAAEQLLEATAQERDAAVANVAAMTQRLDELSAQVEQLRNDRAARRSRRRRLRSNGQ